MQIIKKHKGWLIYTIPMAVAALVRIIFFFQWLDSPFRYYHTLYGLDMRKFLAWGEVFYSKKLPFSMYKFFVNTIYQISGKENLPEAVVIGQMILGVLISGLTVYVFLHFFRNRVFAMVSGLCTALYAPFLIYETQVLKETLFLFLCFLGLASVIFLRRKRFSFLYSFITGIVVTAPFYLRFSGLLLGACMVFWIFLYFLRRKRSLKPLIPIIIGSLALVSIISGYNWKNGRSNAHYFNPSTSYLLGIGKQTDIQSLSYSDNKKVEFTPSAQSLTGYTLHYLKKVGYIFSGYEQPNNVNYYFIRKKIPFLQLLPGPMILIPLGVAGMILLILNFRKNSRISLLLLYMLAAIVPMLLFVPLARYKILLAPVFSVFAAFYLFYVFSRIHYKNRNVLAQPLLVFLTALTFSAYFCRDIPKRQSDIKAFGVTASLIPKQYLSKGEFKKAEGILEKYYTGNQNNPYIMLNYVSSLLCTGQPGKAEGILQKVTKLEDPSLVGDYFYEFAECSSMLNKESDALNLYNIALKHEISEQRRKRAIKRIQEIQKGKND